MDTGAPWLAALFAIAFGALAGGLTNAVAIWMLFHPYQPRGPRWLRLQGAIPKNRARLARTVGRTVGQRLLAAEDLARQLAAPGVRAAFEQALANAVARALAGERGSLRQELPPAILHELESAVTWLVARLAAQWSDFAGTEAFRQAARRFVGRIARELAAHSLGDVLTEARRAALRQRIDTWIAQAAAGGDLEQALDAWLARQIERLSREPTPLLEVLPSGIVTAFERAVQGYLPVALDRLAAVLAHPDARLHVQQLLHRLFQRLVQDLLLHERLVARLVVTERTIARLLEAFERDGADQLARLLEEPTIKARVARGINDAVVGFLRQPIAEHLARLGPERLAGLRQSLASAAAGALRDPVTRAHAVSRLDAALAAAERYTVGDLARHLPAEQFADWLVEAAQAEPVRSWIAEGIQAAWQALADRPIGQLAAALPDETRQRLVSALGSVLWDWIQEQVPAILAHLDIEALVEQKVLGFSVQRIEELVRSTTQKELDLIVRLGYVLGALVGALAWGVSRLLA